MVRGGRGSGSGAFAALRQRDLSRRQERQARKARLCVVEHRADPSGLLDLSQLGGASQVPRSSRSGRADSPLNVHRRVLRFECCKLFVVNNFFFFSFFPPSWKPPRGRKKRCPRPGMMRRVVQNSFGRRSFRTGVPARAVIEAVKAVPVAFPLYTSPFVDPFLALTPTK